MIEFRWDEEKNIINRKKHGVWFEEAQTVFADQGGRLFIDRVVNCEERYVLIGQSNARRLVLVVHCCYEQDGIVRIISARIPTRRERKFYEEGI